MHLVMRRLESTVFHWVVIRNKDTKDLICYWSFSTLREARRKKMEFEEAVGRDNVTIETLPAHDRPKLCSEQEQDPKTDTVRMKKMLMPRGEWQAAGMQEARPEKGSPEKLRMRARELRDHAERLSRQADELEERAAIADEATAQLS